MQSQGVPCVPEIPSQPPAPACCSGTAHLVLSMSMGRVSTVSWDSVFQCSAVLMGILFLYIQSEYNMFQLVSTATYLCSSAVSLAPSSLHLPIKWLHTVLRSQLSFLSLQMNKPTFPSLWVIFWTCSTMLESFLHLEAQNLACYSPCGLKMVKITSFSLLQMNMWPSLLQGHTVEAY